MMPGSSLSTGCAKADATLHDAAFKTPGNENHPPMPSIAIAVKVTGSRHHAASFHASNEPVAKSKPQPNESIRMPARADGPPGLTASRLARNASNAIDEVRAPLKKRTPVGMHIFESAAQTSTQHATPLFRDAAGSFKSYPHCDLLPPLLRFTSSKGHQLMTEPLLETPVSTTTPRLWPQISGSSFGSYQVSASNLGAYQVSVSAMNSMRTPNVSLPPVDTMSKQTTRTQLPILRTAPVAKPEAMASVLPSRPLEATSSRLPVGFIPQPEAPPRGGPVITGCASLASIPTGMTVNSSQSNGKVARPKDRLVINVLPTNRWGAKEYDLFRNIPMSDRPCRCSNSRCLKLYCECFQHGLFCDIRLCRCKGCLNNEENNQPRGERMIAIKKILARRPNAFGMKPKKRTGKGCGCKKSGCLKKYCECVALDKPCNSQCKCTECKNTGRATALPYALAPVPVLSRQAAVSTSMALSTPQSPKAAVPHDSKIASV